jgi:CTP synthase (UTP-ammonia lyase)
MAYPLLFPYRESGWHLELKHEERRAAKRTRVTQLQFFAYRLLNSLTPTGMPSHELELKVGAVIMLLRNLMPLRGLCYGTRLTVIQIQTHIIEAKVISAAKSDTVLIPRIPLIS